MWCETCRYQCLENFFRGGGGGSSSSGSSSGGSSSSPLTLKATPADPFNWLARSTESCCPLICSDISCFSWPYECGPSIALFCVAV